MEIKPRWGEWVGRTVEQMCLLAVDENVRVTCEVNGIKLWADPHEAPSQVVARYADEMHTKPEERKRREQMEKAYPLLVEAAQKALEYLQFIELAEVAQDHLKRGLRAAGKEV